MVCYFSLCVLMMVLGFWLGSWLLVLCLYYLVFSDNCFGGFYLVFFLGFLEVDVKIMI